MSLTSLQRYGEWYYTRYFPSKILLREKIIIKCPDIEMVNQVMRALSPLFIEKNIVESRVHEYISQGKTPYYIRQKLRQKKFETLLVEEVLGWYVDIFHDDETYRKVIETFCRKAQRKWFSRKKIIYELGFKYPDSQKLIWEILKDYSDSTILQDLIPSLLKTRLPEKVIQKCLQSWFSISDIQKVMKELQS